VGFYPVNVILNDFALIGFFLGYLGHLEGDLIPERGHIFKGSWDSSS
jgi:hypothetical protein